MCTTSLSGGGSALLKDLSFFEMDLEEGQLVDTKGESAHILARLVPVVEDELVFLSQKKNRMGHLQLARHRGCVIVTKKDEQEHLQP